MNINNLNTTELEQLQALLNKMNPAQSTIDPVNKMIDGIVENFDWEETQRVMEFMDWKWRGEYVTIDMLKEEGERLLRGAMRSRLGEYKNENHEIGIVNGTGGFEAKAWCDESKTKIIALDLKFVLNSWDESIEEN